MEENMSSNNLLRSAADGWIAAWNSRNLDLLMDHYAEEIIFSSPASARRWNAQDGKLIGKQALERHFKKAFEEFPEMKIMDINLLIGTDGVLLVYRRETGKISADYVQFDLAGKVKEVRVFN
jgi:ketosteroid isomerase-like protein